MPDTTPALRRAVHKRLGRRAPLLSVLVSRLALGGWRSMLVYLLVMAGVFGLLWWSLPKDGGRRAFDVEFRLAIVALFFIMQPVLWAAMRLNELASRCAMKVRVRGLGDTPDPAHVQQRREQWLFFVASEQARPTLAFIFLRTFRGYLLAQWPFAATALVLVTDVGFQSNRSQWALLFPVLLVAAIALQRHEQAKLTKIFQASIEEQRCPCCSYALRGVGDKAAAIGPTRCPECGNRWPLVPPPLFVPPNAASIDRAGKTLPRLRVESAVT